MQNTAEKVLIIIANGEKDWPKTTIVVCEQRHYRFSSGLPFCTRDYNLLEAVAC